MGEGSRKHGDEGWAIEVKSTPDETQQVITQGYQQEIDFNSIEGRYLPTSYTV